MGKPTNDLLRIIQAGGNLSIVAEKPTTDLVELAQTARRMGVKLVLRKVSKPTSDIIAIAQAGGDCVVFEID